MVFSSIVFLTLFLPSCVGVYYIFRRNVRAKNTVLLVFSLAFYGWGEPFFILIMLASITVNWLLGIIVHACRADRGKKKAAIVALVVVNLGMLFVWKYLGFSVSAINSILGTTIGDPGLVLPIGISFFTLQAVSYVLDIAMKGYKPLKSVFDVALYISFFPQLIAGPIVRFETIADQMYNRVETVDDFILGFKRFCLGLFKKVMIANQMGLIANKAFDADPSALAAPMAWLGLLGYAFQILFDFSGYSDMALGLGKMFGFHFLENFDHPYASKSVSEFWRRWHISLGTWFRDYVYFPLGGSRTGSKARLLRNLFVVWMLTGIWHGANLTFFLWGLYYFALIALEKATGFGRLLERHSVLGFLWTIGCVGAGWVVFRSANLGSAFSFFRSMGGFGEAGFGSGSQEWIVLRENLFVFLLAAMFSSPIPGRIAERLVARLDANRRTTSLAATIGSIAILVICMAGLVKSSFNPFIYFNF